MAKKRKPTPRRFYAARRDAKVGTIERKIAAMLDLPPECVHLRLPGNKKARADKTINKLLKAWGW
jgi:hypothetical protein